MPATPDRPRRLRPVLSVRTRITVTITLVAAVALTVVGLAVYVVERASILTQVDDRLGANLESARYLVASGDPDAGSWDSSTDALYALVQRMSPDDNTGVLGIVEGQPALAPGLMLDIDLNSAPGFAAHASAEVADGEPVVGTYVEDGVTWRYLAAPISIEGSPPPTTTLFVLAYDLDAELSEIDSPAQVYLIAAASAIVVIAGVAWLVATRLLRPLRRMRKTAERVSGNALSERVPVEGRDDVAELAVTVNAMLDRLDGALDSQRALLHDVGHELKTPITIVRGYIEVMDPADQADVRDTQALATDELDRMGRLVQDLAGAASLHGPAPIRRRPVDVADLTAQIVRKAEGIAGATVLAGPSADGVAELDAERVTQAMLQLSQNAVTHAGGRLVVGSRLRPDGVDFWVRDYGPGVPDEAKELVFERFHRGHSPEGRGSSGSGLGLNIVQVIARAHEGTARVIDASGGGAVFILSIPGAITASSRPPARTTTTGAVTAVLEETR